ncbi:uncharacterized protein KIAA0232-like isoform X2 [Hemiscyllium ocellatum]|uniref:uncharacterized protein KIAA0232-like isoform X2 n=1 Tax=Hemiscyllium ocellatum TaxID=170820 RepID=UPI002966F6C1|nr:uncharacterized protein KIAA0232-like isoform X2 [Hemiscyllium ocellatum]
MMSSILGLEKTEPMQGHSVQAPTHSSSISSDSSEAENDFYENPEEVKSSKLSQSQCKRWMAGRNQTPKENQIRASLCSTDKPSLRKSTGKGNGLNKQRNNKRWKRSTKVVRKTADLNTATELKFKDEGQEFKEEPQWYTEPLSDNVISNNLKSKLETAYKSSVPSFDTDLLEKLPASIRDLCIDDNCPTDYLWTGAFVDGHFVDIPALLDKGELNEILDCSKSNLDSLDNLQKSVDLIYEGDINQSVMDSCTFDLKQDTGAPNVIGSKDEDLTRFEGEHSVVLDGGPLNIWEDGPTACRLETLTSSSISYANPLSSNWLPSTSESSLIGKTGAESLPKDLSDKGVCWQELSETSEKESYFSVIKNPDDIVFSGETTNWEINSQGEPVSLEPSPSSQLITNKSDDDENKSCFPNMFGKDCNSWSSLCKSGNFRNVDTVADPIELSVNMTTDIPTACSEDDLLSLLPGSEYLQLDDSILIELPVMASKEKLEVTKHDIQTDEMKAGKWNPIFGICQEDLSEKKDDLSSRVIEEIWKASPGENKTTFSEDGIAKCHSCSIGTELSMKQVAPADCPKCSLQNSENNFWEEQLGKSQILDTVDIDMSKHGSEWKIGSEVTDDSIPKCIKLLMTQSNKECEFSSSKNTLLKTASTHSTSESSNFNVYPKSLIKADLQHSVPIEEQSIINDISIDLPEDLWGNLTDYLNDSTEPRECSYLPFELSFPVPQMCTVTSPLDSNNGDMNQQPRTKPKLSSDLIISHNDKLLTSQECMTMSLQSNVYPTSGQLLTKEVVLTRLEDIAVPKPEHHICSDQHGLSESSDSAVGAENLEQDLQILQAELESKSCKETSLDKRNLISQDANEDKLNFLQSHFQDLYPDHDHSKMPQQAIDYKGCTSNNRKTEEDDQQPLEKGKTNNANELELSKECCPFSNRHSEVLLSKAESMENCPKEACCLPVSSKYTDSLCSRNPTIVITSVDANPSEEQSMLTKPNETDLDPEDPRTDQKLCRSLKDCET